MNHPLISFFQNYNEAVIVCTNSYNTLFINQAYQDLTGTTTDSLDKLHPEHLFKIKLNLTESADKLAAIWESAVVNKEGAQQWVRVNRTNYTDSQLGPLLVYTITNNPTYHQLHSLLTESEKRFNTLADSLPVMLWMTDTDNLCYYFNKAWLDFTGRKFEDELGTGWIQHVHPDDVPNFSKATPFLNRKEQYTCEYRLKDAHGHYRNILEIGTPRLLPDGSFTGYMGSCLDITEMKAAQNELSTYAFELKRSNEELEQFAYVASHDLQEPLRMIGSYVQLIKKSIEAGNTDTLEELMAFVLNGVNRMQGLINDLLQYSRVHSKAKPFTAVNMNEVAGIAISHLGHKVSESNAEISTAPLPIVQGDSYQLIRLLQNLIENALKFKRKDVKPEIKITVEDKDAFWQFCVEDNGIGIEEKFHNRIFVIFQRLHGRDDYEGTGIGLSICKKIAERHGGDVWVESAPLSGSRFYFTIKK